MEMIIDFRWVDLVSVESSLSMWEILFENVGYVRLVFREDMQHTSKIH